MLNLLALVVSGALVSATVQNSLGLKQADSAQAVGHLEIQLPHKLEMHRVKYAAMVDSGLSEVCHFFQTYGFSLSPNDLLVSVMVLDGSADSMRKMAKSLGIKPGEIPPTFAGTVVDDTLYLVSEEHYHRIWNKLYPDWEWTDQSYHQLIVHELAHKAHETVAIAETGSSQGMGPDWFFEGLAVMCAGQFDKEDTVLTWEALLAEVGSGKVPKVSYPLYGKLVRSLASHCNMRKIILRASRDGFPDSLPADR